MQVKTNAGENRDIPLGLGKCSRQRGKILGPGKDFNNCTVGLLHPYATHISFVSDSLT